MRRTVQGRRTSKRSGTAARRPREAPPVDALMRIHAVAEATGVPEPTLRAWERRYGIPTPERTATGYRLYSAENIAQVIRMRELCDAGVAAAEAARVVLTGAQASRATVTATPLVAPPTDPLASSRAALLEAVADFDEEALADHTRRLLVLGDAVTVLDHVVRPVLREIGERWHRGELSIAHEHLASHALRGVLADFVRLTPVAKGAPRALLACFADEEHDLPLLGVALRVATWGIRPVVLGARTPPDALKKALASKRASVVLLSASIAPPRERARALIEAYAAACGDTPWVVGGSAARALAPHVEARGGHVEPADLKDLVELLQSLARRPRRARP